MKTWQTIFEFFRSKKDAIYMIQNIQISGISELLHRKIAKWHDGYHDRTKYNM